ncbi:uncharacterized protein [Oscarella lobularis]|uniref:uncharacterized protein isoform X2 n=1 Tax=Oscarella lobularis TaxID=121494 RepID=UPI0033144EC9
MKPSVAFFLVLVLAMAGAPRNVAARMASPPKPKLTSTLYAVLPGRLVTLTCHTSIKPVLWFLNGNKLRESVFHVFQNDRQRLLIPAFRSSDNGTYTCNPANISESNSITVYMTNPPMIDLHSDSGVAYEGNFLIINGTITYKGGSLNITLEDRRGYTFGPKKELSVFGKANFTFILPNITLTLQGLVTIYMQSFLRDTSSRGIYKSKSIFLTLIRKPKTPHVSITKKWPMAIAKWRVPPGDVNYRYDPVSKFKARRTYSNGTSTVQIFNESTKQITIYSPGETITFSVTALGEHTQSGTGLTTIQIECFDPNRPTNFFVDSDTNFVLLNASGKALPICLSNPLPIHMPKGLQLDAKNVVSVARSLGEVHAHYDYSKFYYTNLDLTKLFETSQLVISNGSCPQIVSFCNESQYVKFNNLSHGNLGSPIATDVPTLSSNASATVSLFSNATATTSNTTISDQSLQLVAPLSVAAGLVIVLAMLLPIFIYLKCAESGKTKNSLSKIHRDERQDVDVSTYLPVPAQAYLQEGQTAVNQDDSIEEAEVCKRKTSQEKTASTKESASEKEALQLPAFRSNIERTLGQEFMKVQGRLDDMEERLEERFDELGQQMKEMAPANLSESHNPHNEKLNRKPATEELIDLSKAVVCKWKVIALRLKIPGTAVEQIDLDYNKTQEKAYKVLEAWIEQESEAASVEALCRALCKEGMRATAATIFKLDDEVLCRFGRN